MVSIQNHIVSYCFDLSISLGRNLNYSDPYVNITVGSNPEGTSGFTETPIDALGEASINVSVIRERLNVSNLPFNSSVQTLIDTAAVQLSLAPVRPGFTVADRAYYNALCAVDCWIYGIYSNLGARLRSCALARVCPSPG